jgi:hypothetical protein
MKRYQQDPQEVALDRLENRGKFKITVEFVVWGNDIIDAEEQLKEIVQEGILTLIDNEDREPVYEYDITDIEPAELT